MEVFSFKGLLDVVPQILFFSNTELQAHVLLDHGVLSPADNPMARGHGASLQQHSISLGQGGTPLNCSQVTAATQSLYSSTQLALPHIPSRMSTVILSSSR